MKFRPVVEVSVYADGKKVMDQLTAELLLAVKETGSILAAARKLGMPYSRAWRRISSLEREVGRVVEPIRGGRGGGGAKLTEIGEELLKAYLEGRRGQVMSDFTLASSHDPLLEEAAKEEGVQVRWVGSLAALLYLSVGEADVAGIHIVDVDTGQYNTVVKKLFPGGEVLLIRGFQREVGWAYRRGLSFSLDDVKNGKLRLALRNKGSGTRIMAEKLLGIPLEGKEFYRHDETCKEVSEGRADVTLTIRAVAEEWGLEFSRVCWENFDFAVPQELLRDEHFGLLLNILGRVRDLSGKYPGYKIPEDIGKPFFPRE